MPTEIEFNKLSIEEMLKYMIECSGYSTVIYTVNEELNK
jgi:hypothetical protein